MIRAGRFHAILATAMLWWAATADAAPPAAGSFVDVSANGRTYLTRILGGARVSAEIIGHSLPADRTAGQDRPGDIRCSGGRNPCMLVDALTIRVNGQAIDVPRSVPVRLSDVDRASVTAGGAGVYKLTIECGDASEAYTAIIRFDRKRVKQLDIVDGEAGMLAEQTIYRDLSHAFDN